jgi:hypothetical protein
MEPQGEEGRRSTSPKLNHRRARDKEWKKEMSVWLGLGQGKDFLKMGYGHTGQSTVRDRCTQDSAQ